LAGTEPSPSPTGDQRPRSGDEPLSADLQTRSPRVSTRVLVAVALVLVVLLLVSAVVGFVLLHQPRLAPVPVPSVSSIA
jgi:hypothetical protein